jgi:deoxyribodipyrimidine photolyase-related protein
MTQLTLILGDQLSESISSLEQHNPTTDIILMCEVWTEATYVKHHKKKIAFLFSAMRHFAQKMQNNGYALQYIPLDHPDNTGSFKGEVARIIQSHSIDRIVVTHPGEYRVLADIKTWEATFQIPVEIRPDKRFLCSKEQFFTWAQKHKQMRMEYFYREMRKQHSVLMLDGAPIGGQWNYDSQNRQPPKKNLNIQPPYQVDIDNITADVLQLVEKHFADHFGDLHPFHYAVTREQALEALDVFIRQRLPYFGDYQDAMLEGQPWMYHSHISFYLNCGLLLPLECIKAAETAYHQGIAPINAAEGFIRQILGWREYVMGIYWLKMPEYASANFFNASRNLPDFYWTATTKMNCLRQCVLETRQNAYAHHIQRLMVLGNFALLTGIDPAQVNEWFLIVYADAYEWVELPNVTGMILFADGGYLASKPYAAGGAYINKMSNYCKNCQYSVAKKTGPDACPFNYLYWNFLEKNRNKLESNPRIGMMYRVFDKMPDTQKKQIKTDSSEFFASLENK